MCRALQTSLGLSSRCLCLWLRLIWSKTKAAYVLGQMCWVSPFHRPHRSQLSFPGLLAPHLPHLKPPSRQLQGLMSGRWQLPPPLQTRPQSCIHPLGLLIPFWVCAYQDHCLAKSCCPTLRPLSLHKDLYLDSMGKGPKEPHVSCLDYVGYMGSFYKGFTCRLCSSHFKVLLDTAVFCSRTYISCAWPLELKACNVLCWELRCFRSCPSVSLTALSMITIPGACSRARSCRK